MRKARYVLPTVALIIGVSVFSGLLLVRNDMEERLEEELDQFGNNLIALPETDDIELTVGGVSLGSMTETHFLPEAAAKDIVNIPLDEFDGKVCRAPIVNAFLFNVVKVFNETDVIMGGTWFLELSAINVWWKLLPGSEYPSNDNEMLLGKTAAEKLNLGVGNSFSITYSEIVTNATGNHVLYHEEEMIVTGIVDAGGEDDSRIFGKLAAMQNLTNLHDKVSILHISTLCKYCDLEAVGEKIEELIDGVDIVIIKQITNAKQATFEFVQNLVGFITIVAIVTSLVAVMTTMMLSVVERRKEIGLMKTIGAYDTKIAAMFLGEGLLIAVVGGVLGFFLGIFIAQLIGDFAFDSSIAIDWFVIVPSLGVSVAVVILASVLPIRKALSVDPVVVLRGE
jgi:putative ABC transport system permease protein